MYTVYIYIYIYGIISLLEVYGIYLPTFYSGILFCIYSDILAGTLSGIYSEIFPGIFLTFFLSFYLACVEVGQCEIYPKGRAQKPEYHSIHAMKTDKPNIHYSKMIQHLLLILNRLHYGHQFNGWFRMAKCIFLLLKSIWLSSRLATAIHHPGSFSSPWFVPICMNG